MQESFDYLFITRLAKLYESRQSDGYFSVSHIPNMEFIILIGKSSKIRDELLLKENSKFIIRAVGAELMFRLCSVLLFRVTNRAVCVLSIARVVQFERHIIFASQHADSKVFCCQ